MVSAKHTNSKKRNGAIQNNQRRFKAPIRRNGVVGNFNHRTPLPLPPAPINPMFTANQIPDNPGYVDFNEPTPPRLPSPVKVNINPASVKNHRYPRRGGPNNTNNKPAMQRNQNNANGWGPTTRGPPPGQMGNQPPMQSIPHGRNFRNAPMPRIGRPMPPPMGMRPPMPPLPAPPNMNPNRFGPPRPMMPPPMAGCPVPPSMGPPRPPMRLRGGPIPLPRPVMLRGGNGPGSIGGIGNTGGGGPMRRGKGISNNRKNLRNRNKRPIGGIGQGQGGSAATVKNKKTTTKKTLSEIVNQYPLDKPWVTDEIRTEQKKKEDIENKLKGNKDDKLFAEFKVQRDKFVKMYEAARLEFIGKHPEQDIDKIMTESDKKKGDSNAKENRKTNEKPATA